jgi:hypothetical protein
MVEGIAQAGTCKNLEERMRVKGKLDKMKKFVGVYDLQFWHENKLKYIFVVIIYTGSKFKLFASSKRRCNLIFNIQIQYKNSNM